MGLSWWWLSRRVETPETYFRMFRPYHLEPTHGSSTAELRHILSKIEQTDFCSTSQAMNLIHTSEERKNELLFDLHSTLHDSFGKELQIPHQVQLLPERVLNLAIRITEFQQRLKKQG